MPFYQIIDGHEMDKDDPKPQNLEIRDETLNM